MAAKKEKKINNYKSSFKFLTYRLLVIKVFIKFKNGYLKQKYL